MGLKVRLCSAHLLMMDSHTINVDIGIMQWNCQSLRPKAPSLESLLTQEKIHIAILSETWLEPDSLFKISNYIIHRLDRRDGYGGVAILLHRSIRSFNCNSQCTNSGIELLHIKVLNCRHIENIISI